ncbi:MAG: HAMP domain-containing histidine kinase [Flavobacteriales bacterium]|nr:HAMP domain-containing histidine kinase [Flavobacteriales bacterium]
MELNQRLLTAGRQTLTGETRSLGLAALVRDCVLYVQGHPSVRGCRLDLTLEGPATVEGHAVLLHQLVGNLILNAGEATGGKGRIEIRLTQAEQEVVLEVHDNGPGVPEERRAGIFEALHTTKASGSGLGLFSVKACVDTHGGHVMVTSSQLGGACFRVRLPRRASQLKIPAGGSANPTPATRLSSV